MREITFDTPVIKIPGLETKFDTSVLSNSFVALIGDYIEARIVQQLHYWSYSKYGVVINDLRWIYKPIREWLSEAFIGFTSWQLRKAIASLVAKGILLKEHLFKEHHGNNFSPKNRTYYYSVNYEQLEKLFQEQELAQLSEQSPARAHSRPSPLGRTERQLCQDAGATRRTIENVRFVSSTKQFCESSEKQFCESAKNKTENTSIENNSIEKSHPTLPCESESLNAVNQEASLGNLVNSENQEIDLVNLGGNVQDTDIPHVEGKVNQNLCTDEDVVQQQVAEPRKSTARPRIKTPKGTKSVSKRMKLAPWKDEEQFKRFYRALIQALPIVANARSPQGLAQVIIRQLRAGVPHTYWDDFAAGLPIGTSTKPEWEIEPGVPYPMFIEYLTEKTIKGNNTQTSEQARNEVFRILSQPRQAKAFWGQFKRSVVNVSEQVERDRALGVSNPNTPVWTRERIEPSIKEAAAAGLKIATANGEVQNAIAAVKVHQLESKDSLSVSHSSSLPASPSPEDPWNDSDRPQPTMREMLAARKVKGFCQPMPKVSQAEIAAEERQQRKPKANIAQMSLIEINDYLKDPVLRAQLTPQLFHSNYELITDDLGQIIVVKPPSKVEE